MASIVDWVWNLGKASPKKTLDIILNADQLIRTIQDWIDDKYSDYRIHDYQEKEMEEYHKGLFKVDKLTQLLSKSRLDQLTKLYRQVQSLLVLKGMLGMLIRICDQYYTKTNAETYTSDIGEKAMYPSNIEQINHAFGDGPVSILTKLYRHMADCMYFTYAYLEKKKRVPNLVSADIANIWHFIGNSSFGGFPAMFGPYKDYYHKNHGPAKLPSMTMETMYDKTFNLIRTIAETHKAAYEEAFGTFILPESLNDYVTVPASTANEYVALGINTVSKRDFCLRLFKCGLRVVYHEWDMRAPHYTIRPALLLNWNKLKQMATGPEDQKLYDEFIEWCTWPKEKINYAQVQTNFIAFVNNTLIEFCDACYDGPQLAPNAKNQLPGADDDCLRWNRNGAGEYIDDFIVDSGWEYFFNADHRIASLAWASKFVLSFGMAYWIQSRINYEPDQTPLTVRLSEMYDKWPQSEPIFTGNAKQMGKNMLSWAGSLGTKLIGPLSSFVFDVDSAKQVRSTLKKVDDQMAKLPPNLLTGTWKVRTTDLSEQEAVELVQLVENHPGDTPNLELIPTLKKLDLYQTEANTDLINKITSSASAYIYITNMRTKTENELTSILTGINSIKDNCNKFITSAVKEIGTQIQGYVQPAIDKLIDLMGRGQNLIETALNTIIDASDGVRSGWETLNRKITGVIAKILDQPGDFLISIVSDLIDLIRETILPELGNSEVKLIEYSNQLESIDITDDISLEAVLDTIQSIETVNSDLVFNPDFGPVSQFCTNSIHDVTDPDIELPFEVGELPGSAYNECIASIETMQESFEEQRMRFQLLSGLYDLLWNKRAYAKESWVLTRYVEERPEKSDFGFIKYRVGNDLPDSKVRDAIKEFVYYANEKKIGDGFKTDLDQKISDRDTWINMCETAVNQVQAYVAQNCKGVVYSLAQADKLQIAIQAHQGPTDVPLSVAWANTTSGAHLAECLAEHISTDTGNDLSSYEKFTLIKSNYAEREENTEQIQDASLKVEHLKYVANKANAATTIEELSELAKELKEQNGDVPEILSRLSLIEQVETNISAIVDMFPVEASKNEVDVVKAYNTTRDQLFNAQFTESEVAIVIPNCVPTETTYEIIAKQLGDLRRSNASYMLNDFNLISRTYNSNTAASSAIIGMVTKAHEVLTGSTITDQDKKFLDTAGTILMAVQSTVTDPSAMKIVSNSVMVAGTLNEQAGDYKSETFKSIRDASRKMLEASTFSSIAQNSAEFMNQFSQVYAYTLGQEELLASVNCTNVSPEHEPFYKAVVLARMNSNRKARDYIENAVVTVKRKSNTERVQKDVAWKKTWFVIVPGMSFLFKILYELFRQMGRDSPEGVLPRIGQAFSAPFKGAFTYMISRRSVDNKRKMCVLAAEKLYISGTSNHWTDIVKNLITTSSLKTAGKFLIFEVGFKVVGITLMEFYIEQTMKQKVANYILSMDQSVLCKLPNLVGIGSVC